MSSRPTNYKLPTLFVTGFLIGLTLIGFSLRLNHLLGRLFYIDEYYSMLSALMILEKGVPVLPSGSFYDSGLLASYLSAVSMILMGGFSEVAVRWPMLLISTLTISVSYTITRKLFLSQFAGLAAALLFVFEPTSILWGGRVRMYAPAYLFVILAVYFAYLGFIQKPNRTHRLLFVVTMLGALWSHYVTVFLFAAMGIVTLGYFLFKRSIDTSWMGKKTVFVEIIFTFVIFALILNTLSFSFAGSNLAVDDPAHRARSTVGLGYLAGYFDREFNWDRIAVFIPYFQRQANLPLDVLAGVTCLYAIVHIVRRQSQPQDFVSIYIGLILLLTIVLLGMLAEEAWHDRRYLYILSMPLLIFLASYSFVYIGKSLNYPLQKVNPVFHPSYRYVNIIVLCPITVVILGVWGQSALDASRPDSNGGYATAFSFIKENWQPDDQTITWHPAACYVYLKHCDYYANQTTAKLTYLNGQWVDQWVGTPYIDTVDTLNQIFANGKRTWFVVDIGRFYERYEEYMRQQFLNQMYLLRNDDGVLTFQSRSDLHPIAESPSKHLSANFDIAILAGYHLEDLEQSKQKRQILLTTFWQPNIPFPYKKIKAFIHLRNEANETIAQADHELFGVHDNMLAIQGEWNLVRNEGRWLRDSTVLFLPEQLPSGLYYLYIGLYDPNTLVRYPLANDRSGENAVQVTKITVTRS